MVDVGCGAGTLGLAAAALGIPRAVEVDLSPAAVRASRNNARENGLAAQLRIVQGSTQCLKSRFDLVAANLPWEVQLDKVNELDRLASPGGWLLLSGFRDNQETELRESYHELGWTLARRVVKEFSHPELPSGLSFTWVAWLLE
jgi:ribosomal protein L11 methyltransferase